MQLSIAIRNPLKAINPPPAEELKSITGGFSGWSKFLMVDKGIPLGVAPRIQVGNEGLVLSCPKDCSNPGGDNGMLFLGGHT